MSFRPGLLHRKTKLRMLSHSAKQLIRYIISVTSHEHIPSSLPIVRVWQDVTLTWRVTLSSASKAFIAVAHLGGSRPSLQCIPSMGSMQDISMTFFGSFTLYCQTVHGAPVWCVFCKEQCLNLMELSALWSSLEWAVTWKERYVVTQSNSYPVVSSVAVPIYVLPVVDCKTGLEVVECKILLLIIQIIFSLHFP